MFEQGTDEVQSAFKFAMLNHNVNMTARRFELQAYVDVIKTADAFKLSKLSKYSISQYYMIMGCVIICTYLVCCNTNVFLNFN